MASNKTKIVLDADVIIHFLKGDSFKKLIDIFPEYQYLILDVVYTELSKHLDTKVLIDKYTHFFSSRVTQIRFTPTGEMMKEYAKLIKTLGKGESACMTYCGYNQDVLGSSNLRDIKDYCEEHGITYLTTLDFLYYAFVRKLMTKEECDSFILQVNAMGSKLPKVDISQYRCTVII